MESPSAALIRHRSDSRQCIICSELSLCVYIATSPPLNLLFVSPAKKENINYVFSVYAVRLWYAHRVYPAIPREKTKMNKNNGKNDNGVRTQAARRQLDMVVTQPRLAFVADAEPTQREGKRRRKNCTK